jgi:trimethylamine--corrinoid protein Co-methyltransferase
MRPTLNVLSDELITQILDEAKRIMAETGMEIRGEVMKKRLLDHGLKTDASGKRVLFPADVVEKAIASAPSCFTLYNRDGESHAELGGYNVHYVPGSSGQVSDAWRLYLCLTTSKKPVVSGAFTEHGVPPMVRMLELFRKDRAELIEKPMTIFTITATGNFRYGEDSCQNLLDCVEAGIPVEIVPVTLMGLIAPVTLVGALVFHCVDVLTGLTMAQIVRPGAPVLFGGAPATFHMKAASSPMAAIEAQHLNVAYVAISKALNLPSQAYMALGDGKFLDAQAGGETFSSALLAALAGVNSVSGPGMLDFVLTFSLPKLVFDNEVCGQAMHFVREIHPLDDLPAAGLVDELRKEDHLITAEHTLAHWPRELYLTDPVIDRDNRETWEEKGSRELYDRACEQVDQRLAGYSPIETDPAVDEAMRALVTEGLAEQTELPEIPPVPEKAAASTGGRRRGRRRRRSAENT